MKTYIVGTHQKRLGKALLMSTHNICFHGEIRKLSVLFCWKSALSRAILFMYSFCSGAEKLYLSYPRHLLNLQLLVIWDLLATNFMLCWVEHEKSFITSGPGLSISKYDIWQLNSRYTYKRMKIRVVIFFISFIWPSTSKVSISSDQLTNNYDWFAASSTSQRLETVQIWRVPIMEMADGKDHVKLKVTFRKSTSQHFDNKGLKVGGGLHPLLASGLLQLDDRWLLHQLADRQCPVSRRRRHHTYADHSSHYKTTHQAPHAEDSHHTVIIRPTSPPSSPATKEVEDPVSSTSASRQRATYEVLLRPLPRALSYPWEIWPARSSLYTD